MYFMRIVNCLYFKIFFFLFCFTLIKTFGFVNAVRSSSVKPQATEYTALRLMTFNTYQAGSHVKDGLRKIAKHILAVNPDIVALQEIDSKQTEILLVQLGSEWSRCSAVKASPYWFETAIITRKEISQNYTQIDGFSNVGCKIRISTRKTRFVEIDIWNIHLNYRFYSPYYLCVKTPPSTLNEVYDQEYKSRDPNTLSRVDSVRMVVDRLSKTVNDPDLLTVLAGDFNTPSALDWVTVARRRHCNLTANWPVSKILHENGFVDSYRSVNVDPVAYPGITWSPIQYYFVGKTGYLEPQDRIDFIYYRGSRINAVSSMTYVGEETVRHVPNEFANDWPSDHASVITDFDIKL